MPVSMPSDGPPSVRPHRPGAVRRRRASAALTVVAALTALTVGHPPVAAAPAAAVNPAASAANPYERGPAPTSASIDAARGPFAIAQTVVRRASVTGFGGGTIYYPTTTTTGTFGAVAIAPGYYGPEFSIGWYGPRLASQGFVVMTIATTSVTDQPDSRARQLLAALDYLVQRSKVRTRIDPDRLGVMGHSMGGGGSLAAARQRPELQAAIPITPWYPTTDWSAVQVPTLIIGAENDTTAPVGSYAEPFYRSLPAALDKAYLELDGASHVAPISANVTIARYSISWLKRFIDNDLRYEQFLCPAPTGGRIQEYLATCPYS